MMRVMVVGSGGREHALAWRLARSDSVGALYCAPGNPGTATHATNLPVSSDDIDGLTRAAVDLAIDLVVVGPELPLSLGLVDSLNAAGVVAFGPTSAAARIEASKSWAKEIMRSAGVPTARSQTVSHLAEGLLALESFSFPVVLKADGLAAGKGVVIAVDKQEANDVLRSFLQERLLGEAGGAVLIETFLQGREISVIAITDGETIHPLPAACDYKRAFDGDLGPNTGGMGAYAPAPFVDAELLATIQRTILQPTVDAMNRAGCPMRGALYAGIMLTRNGPMVLEYNARFGDPETQVIMPLLEGDFARYLFAAATGRLAEHGGLTTSEWCAVAVVLASGGYPGPYVTGHPITGIPTNTDRSLVFHAGTAAAPNGGVVTAGGRVLTAAGLGASMPEAHHRAYDTARQIAFEGMHYRTDIAARELV